MPLEALARAALASAAIVFIYVAYWALRRYRRENVDDYPCYVEIFTTLIFTLLAMMSLIALTVSASTP